MQSFLKRHYLNDAKLAQRALLEFHRALTSGRLIALTGSMTTEPCGYGKWGQLVEAYGRLADVARSVTTSSAEAKQAPNAWQRMQDELKAIADDQESTALRETSDKGLRVQRFRNYFAEQSKPNAGGDKFDLRVALGLFEEALLDPDPGTGLSRACGNWDLDVVRTPLDLLSVAMAQYFRSPHHRRGSAEPPPPDVVKALIRSIGARRVATLNYDFELEAQLMLPDLPGNAFDRLREMRAKQRGDVFEWQLSSGRIRRVMPGGRAVESDILNRERIDRMLEFAIGADDVDQHILHLHGRCCDANSMILSYRDYDRLYRRSSLSKLPFEFAQRILMGGNPILFVGMGMSEGELNQSLQDFVSNSPYHREAPTFLLWNVSDTDQEGGAERASRMEMLRLDWLHRLNVLTIFDADLTELERKAGESPHARLVRLIEALPGHAARVAERERFNGEAFSGTIGWRCSSRAEKVAESVIVWQLSDRSLKLHDAWALRRDAAWPLLTGLLKARSAPILGIIAKQGSGKGSLGHRLITNSPDIGIEQRNAMLVNAGFSFDTDSVLDAITRFVRSRTSTGTAAATGECQPVISRSAFFRSLPAGERDPLLIVLNGCERFFSIRGDLLSAELHELLWLAAQERLPGVRLVLIGTARIRPYLQKLKAQLIESGEIGLEPSWSENLLPIHRLDAIARAFAEHGVDVVTLAPGKHRVLEQAKTALRASAAARISGDLGDLRRAFFDLYLDPHVLAAGLVRGGEELKTIPSDEAAMAQLGVAMEIARALAFIGLPVEAGVLAYVPLIRDLDKANQAMVYPILEKLLALGLVLELDGHSHMATPRNRYTLPRLLLSELRARFSVPLSEAKLSTAFNMSLYVAQPVDGYIPEPEIHDELGTMVDRLLGAYRDMARDDETLPPDCAPADLDVINHDLLPHEHVGGALPEHETLLEERRRQLVKLAGQTNIQCLRAALALVRGYYTTTDLLTLDVRDRLVREDRYGILLEHAERLDAIIDSYGKIALARQRLRAAVAKVPGTFDAIFGPIEPLYPDELVWLHNERGVIRLAMGDLYEARASFLRALDINTRHVEGTDRSHNWRRIRLNQLTLDLESGEIGLAQRKIEEILVVSGPGASIDSREDRLASAVATGYRAWSRHLHGEREAALADYKVAVEAFSVLGEARAEVYFRRLRITLLAADSRAELSQRELDATLDLALATRQMDLVYRLRVMREVAVLESPDSSPQTRKAARQVLEDAHQYALQTDVHRVRVEAGMGLAVARSESGDYEGALRAVSDAMMVATRFGLELRKIVLRSLMAQIMAERGHPITASNLAATAIRVGSRLRYAQAVRHAERTLAAIPSIGSIAEYIETAEHR